MRRDVWRIESPSTGGAGDVIAYGHWGRPVLFFPAEGGSAVDLEDRGVIGALAEAIDGGRIKVYAVDSYDAASWSNSAIALEDRAREHEKYHSWVVDQVLPAIHGDCGGAIPVAAAGASLGAFHAVNLALRRADLVPYALGMSGSYDPAAWNGWGEQGDALYFTNPFSYVTHLHGDHLDWLRRHVFVQLCVGTGAWEVHPTRALPSTRALSDLLRHQGIPHGLDVWGEDTPHDWPSWARMSAVHLGHLG